MLESVFGVHPTYLIELTTIPLFTGIIGYITNWTGVLMLFKPLGFHGFRVPGLKTLFPYLPKRIQVLPLFRYDGQIGWQGIVPSRADKMASLAVDKGLAKLGSVGDFYQELEPESIAAAFAEAGVDLTKPIVTSCGSGVNAAILTLALEMIGVEKSGLYDGSWTEWGGRDDTPVAVGDDNGD